MQHSPPATRAATDKLENSLRETVRQYRRDLQKIARLKTKILCALREGGVRQAEDLLLVPPREAEATRCETCVGCITLSSLGPCATCPDCLGNSECTEHTRLCFAWRQPPTTYVAGSVVTGVSSVCNIADYDLRKYRDLLDKLGEDSVDIEAALDELPSGAPQHANDRYNTLRRTRDIHMEEAQFATIEAMLYRYQEERVRLADVLSDGEDDSNDAVDVGPGLSPPDLDQPFGFGLTSHTQTHYPFLATNIPEGFNTLVPPQDPGPDDLGLGLGLGQSL